MIQSARNKMEAGKVAAMLLGQDGVFELTAPGGEIFRVTCQRGVGMAFTRVGEADGKTQNTSDWRIRRG